MNNIFNMKKELNIIRYISPSTVSDISSSRFAIRR